MSFNKKIAIAEYEGKDAVLAMFPACTHVIASGTWTSRESGVGCQAVVISSVRDNQLKIVDAVGKSLPAVPSAYIYNGDRVLPNPALQTYKDKIGEVLGKTSEDFTFREMAKVLWRTNDYSMYILGDNLQSGAGTQKFAQWLIDNEYGIVTSSPGVLNRTHRRDPHFCQVWIWVPPEAARLSVPARRPVVGTDKMDPDAIIGQPMVSVGGEPMVATKYDGHDTWHKDLNFVKRALVLTKAEMTPIKRKRMVRKKIV